MQLSPNATDRQPDEVLLYRGFAGDEIVIVFVSHAADHLNHWRIRAVFCDFSGEPLEQRVMHLPRTKRLVFCITRSSKPDFTFPVPCEGSSSAAAPSLFNPRRN